MNNSKKFVIIDGHHLLFRMFYGIPSRIRTKDGILINAVIGFISAILKYIKTHEPQYLIVVFDSEKPNYRSEIEKDYKGNRQSNFSNVCDDDNPFLQLTIIQKILDILAIKYCEIDGFETDDVIASYAAKYDEMQKYIISGDSDLLQLVNRNTIVFMDRGEKSITYNENMVLNKFQVSPPKIVDYKALVGDKSDNISGLAGIGPKTAVNLINQFGCIENIIKQSCEITPQSLREKIENGSNILSKNKYLISLCSDVPLNLNIADLIIDYTAFLATKTMDILRENKYV